MEGYEQACGIYLNKTLDENQPEEILESARRILSNPMDLTTLSDMLAKGQEPDLFHLQEQQYNVMAADYKYTCAGQEFPLQPFSEEVYQTRIRNESVLPSEKYIKELQCMESHKMVVSRQYEDARGGQRKEWSFRHDKIWDFFIVQAFMGQDNDKPLKHIDDPRFRGVYFLLAALMPLKDAEALREHLINHAADTRDHSVSDTFIQLLRSRKAMNL